jgi:hypothetical protein
LAEELDHAGPYLASFSPTKKMKRFGINRSKQMRYTIENYVIRTQSFFDRVLILVNEILRIGMSDRDVTQRSILRNMWVDKVLDERITSIRSSLDRYREPRNVIIHRGSLKDELLWLAEASELLDEDVPRALTRERKRMVIQDWLRRFTTLNGELYNKTTALFDLLVEYYTGTRRRLVAFDDRITKGRAVPPA